MTRLRSGRDVWLTPTMIKALALIKKYRWAKIPTQTSLALHSRGLVMESTRRNGMFRLTIEGEAECRRLIDTGQIPED